MSKSLTGLTERFSYNPNTSQQRQQPNTAKSKITKPHRGYKHHPSELKYVHLSPLPDLLLPNLKLVFCGFNPGIQSATLGHRFAHRSNSFWRLLHESGLVEIKLTFEDDVCMPETHRIGFTELVMRPTKGVDEIPQREMRANVPRLVDTINEYSPKVVCFVGRGIWDSIAKVMHIRQEKFEWGEQVQNVLRAKCFVVPSTSGLVRIKHEDKLVIWRGLKRLVDECDT